MANAIRARRLLEASEAGSIDLFKELKKIKVSKKSSEGLPDLVADATGEKAIV